MGGHSLSSRNLMPGQKELHTWLHPFVREIWRVRRFSLSLFFFRLTPPHPAPPHQTLPQLCHYSLDTSKSFWWWGTQNWAQDLGCGLTSDKSGGQSLFWPCWPHYWWHRMEVKVSQLFATWSSSGRFTVLFMVRTYSCISLAATNQATHVCLRSIQSGLQFYFLVSL